MNNHRKRPRPHASHDCPTTHFGNDQHHQQDNSSGTMTALDFNVRGYEATLTYGQEAFARLLRLPEEQGGRLMRWIGDGGGADVEEGEQREQELWIDRYDVLHLLPSIPNDAQPPSPPSSTGWSDLPSDAEDTFFLSGDEGQEYSRGKKRRRMEAGRVERMEALRVRMAKEAEEEEGRKKDGKGEKDEWGDDDEETTKLQRMWKPPAAIKTLMEHTSKSLSSSPNPQVLELRILTHHAGDTRFSFLKGRYKNTWQAIKRGEKVDMAGPLADAEKTSKGGLGGLMGDYGDSDSEDDSDLDEVVPDPPPLPPLPPTEEGAETETAFETTMAGPPEPETIETAPSTVMDEPVTGDEEEKARAARREKARAWMAARRQTGESTKDKES